MDVFSTALSGLRAADTRLAASANNTVNANTPDYQPVDAVQKSTDNGVIVDIRNREPANFQVQTEDGVKNLPNVSLEQEQINSISAANDYKADLRVIKAQKDMFKSLLDIQA